MKVGDLYVKIIDYQIMFHVIKSISNDVVVRDFILVRNNGVLNIRTETESITTVEEMIDRAELKPIDIYHVSWLESFIKKIFYCDVVSKQL